MVCPVSEEVCGPEREFTIEIPNLIDDLVATNPLIVARDMPPGYVCSYTIRLEQTLERNAAPLLTEMIVRKLEDYDNI